MVIFLFARIIRYLLQNYSNNLIENHRRKLVPLLDGLSLMICLFEIAGGIEFSSDNNQSIFRR